MKNRDCIGCHQLGQLSTRTIPPRLGEFKSGEEAWMRRVQSGPVGEQMVNPLAGTSAARRSSTSAIGPTASPRASCRTPSRRGRKASSAISWSRPGNGATPKKYLHDLIASDRRNPTVNAYGPLYGSPEYSTDLMPILDPEDAQGDDLQDAGAGLRTCRRRSGPDTRRRSSRWQPSAYWGEEKIWDTKANNHNAMFDKKGRVWMAANVRGMDNPAFCKKGSDHPSAKVFPLERSSRQVAMLDPKTMKYTFVDTCFGTHHPQFGYDANDTLWLSGTGPVAGWINTKMFDETGDAAKSQGWSPFVLDTNGNGKRDEFVEPNQPLDPAKDKRIVPGSGPYAVMPSPVDGSIWYTVGVFGGTPAVLRFDPATGLSESLQRADARLRHPRRRHRQERRRLGVARKRPSRQLRPAQVQRAAQRPERDRRPLPGRLGRSTSIPGPGFQGIGENSAEFELLHLGRPAQHVRARREHPDVDRQPQ